VKGFFSTLAANLAEALYRQGRLDEAGQYAELSRDAGATDDFVNEILWRMVAARVQAARGQVDEAEALARAAVEIAEDTDLLDMRAGASLALAEVLLAARSEEAGRAIDEAVRLYEQKGNVVGAARAKALL
jgi:ATP/maltotriose-dependent transcriptional regulator MalT